MNPVNSTAGKIAHVTDKLKMAIYTQASLHFLIQWILGMLEPVFRPRILYGPGPKLNRIYANAVQGEDAYGLLASEGEVHDLTLRVQARSIYAWHKLVCPQPQGEDEKEEGCDE